ncbi:MAG: NAD(P)H-hydrate dehydratase [Rhodocyclaceae bacterium]|nr:MAG: NAD(P)H-hydrate dehydratase [Rhodocyclaceae bacterium]
MRYPQPILRSAALRNLERLQNGLQPPLMERAGAAASDLAEQLLAGSGHPPLIVAGPGNNGGDALVVARLLGGKGIQPVVVFAGKREKLPADARAAHDAWLASGGVLHAEIPTGDYGLVIDGLFGIGLGDRPVEGRFAALVASINELGCPVLSLDIPSGLDSDTGRVMGLAVVATYTATFIALKPGLLTQDGPDHCGAVSVHDLGVNVDTSDGSTIARQQFARQLRARRTNSHKGSYGSAGILGGAPGMAGATLLAGRAALKLGAGRVYIGMAEKLAVDPLQPELMLHAADEVFSLATCLAVGPGLGQSAAALTLVRRAIDTDLPLLLDADALNLLAAHPVLAGVIARRTAPTLLTPHPAEAARLLASDVETVQADRVSAALELARRLNAATVLKGCGSIVAFPDRRWFINTTGNPGLASAGTGDVLCGMMVALLAQGWPADQALLASVHLHGAAADACVAAGAGPVGLTAGELIEPARSLLNHWIASFSPAHA